MNNQKNGGELFDTDNTDPENLEIILHHVRHRIGVEYDCQVFNSLKMYKV